MKRGLRGQLSLGFALIILVTVALISVVSNLLITREFESYMGKQQDEYTAEIAMLLNMQYTSANEWNEDYIHGVGMYALNDGYFVKVSDGDGNVLWDAESHDMEYCHQIMQEIEERMASLSGSKKNSRTYYVISDGAIVGAVEIEYYCYNSYYYNDNAFVFLNSLNVILVVIGVLAIAAAVCVGILFAKRISTPIAKVTEIADEIAGGNYGARADVSVKTRELVELGNSINNMAERIGRQESLRRQLTSDVAHELRTPLANVAAQLEVIIEGIFEPSPERLQGIYDEVERLSSLVSELEKLQQIENNVLERGDFDLLSLAGETVELFGAEAEKHGVRCAVEGEPVTINADKGKIKQVINNLLSNAIKYSPDGGEVKVAVKDCGDKAEISVSDNGIGIPKTEQQLIFERFYRTDKSRNRKTGGVGIGLTIVNAIVSAHGGTVTVESEEGKGSTFTVTLPKGL